MTQPFDFVKSHGLGNDYLVIDEKRLGFALTPTRIRRICDRHLGVGSDGILLLEEGEGADFAVRILNPDGSQAEKSGNGLRIFAKFLHDHGYTDRPEFTVATLSGVVRAQLLPEVGEVRAVRVEMGRAVIDPDLTVLEVDGERLPVVSLSVGNPHCVHITSNLAGIDFHRLGPGIENHRSFPNRTNVQFAEVLGRDAVRALMWERGAGHTLASGSSACAVATACYSRGLVDERVTVRMEGGDLLIELDLALNLVMTGPVEEVCTGHFCEEFRAALLALE